MSGSHLIKKQTLEVTLDSQEGSFFQELGKIYRNRLVPVLESIFNELENYSQNAADEIISIEKLDIDLGSIEKRDLEDEFIKKARIKIREALHEMIEKNDPALVERKSQSERSLNILKHYFENGSLPWWGGQHDLRALLRDQITRQPGELETLFKQLIHGDHNTHRRIHFLARSDQELAGMIARLEPGGKRGLRLDHSEEADARSDHGIETSYKPAQQEEPRAAHELDQPAPPHESHTQSKDRAQAWTHILDKLRQGELTPEQKIEVLQELSRLIQKDRSAAGGLFLQLIKTKESAPLERIVSLLDDEQLFQWFAEIPALKAAPGAYQMFLKQHSIEAPPSQRARSKIWPALLKLVLDSQAPYHTEQSIMTACSRLLYLLPPESANPPARGDQADDANPTARGDQADDANPPAHGDQADDANPPARRDQADDANPPARGDQADDANPPARGDQADQANPPAHGDQADDANPTARGDQADQANPTARGDQAGQANPPAHGDQADDANPPARGDQAGQANPTARGDQSRDRAHLLEILRQEELTLEQKRAALQELSRLIRKNPNTAGDMFLQLIKRRESAPLERIVSLLNDEQLFQWLLQIPALKSAPGAYQMLLKQHSIEAPPSQRARLKVWPALLRLVVGSTDNQAPGPTTQSIVTACSRLLHILPPEPVIHTTHSDQTEHRDRSVSEVYPPLGDHSVHGSLPGFGGHTSSEAAEYYIKNGGLILLWPFLPEFFKRLGLASENQITHPHKALLMLHYLAHNKPPRSEDDLTLNKFLCGVGFKEAVDLDKTPSAEEQAAIDELLRAASAHWPGLSQVSSEWLRQVFLRRAGALKQRNGQWILQVESAVQDALLQRLPWAISLVKLPWLETILSVEWSI